MPFPISISQTITCAQPKKKITSNGYLLNRLFDKLESLDMTSTRLSENEYIFMNTDIMRAFRKKDFLRNVSVVVETHQSEIKVKLKSNTLLIFISGFLPLVFLFIDQHFAMIFVVVLSCFFWTIGYLIRWFALREVKSDLEHHLKKILE